MNKKVKRAVIKKQEHVLHVWDPLLKENIFFPQFTDATPDPILITDTKGKIYYANPAWEKLTGYDFEEVRGKNPKLLKSGKTPPIIYEKIWKNLLRGDNFHTEQEVNRKKNGEEFQISSTYFPVKKNGKSIFYAQMMRDISERKHIEEQKDEFIGIASHELKTPITTLSVYSQMLERRLKMKGDKNEFTLLSHIIRETKKLTSLIDDLLNVSRLDSGKIRFDLEPFDLSELVSMVVEDFQNTKNTHKIKVLESVHGNVFGDRNRVEQVIINVLNNAVKYSPNARQVDVRLINQKSEIVVAVQDYGFGIAEEDVPHLFDRFYRTRQKNEERISGFGLGLYLCAQIINRHHGSIWVESEKGKGSTFYFSLPKLEKSN